MSTVSNKIPFGQKVAFGIGMLANQMFPAAMGIFMVVLVQDLGFPGWMWGVIFFLPRVFDSITDPIMGFISDQLIKWHKTSGRHNLPWQNTDNPYLIWLSEIMLQQTQVSTVLTYFEKLNLIYVIMVFLF